MKASCGHICFVVSMERVGAQWGANEAPQRSVQTKIALKATSHNLHSLLEIILDLLVETKLCHRFQKEPGI